MLNDSYRLCDNGYVGSETVGVFFAAATFLLQVFRGITQLRPSEENHSGKLGTRSGGTVSGLQVAKHGRGL